MMNSSVQESGKYRKRNEALLKNGDEAKLCKM